MSALPPLPHDDAPSHPSDSLDPSQFALCNPCSLALSFRDSLDMPQLALALRDLELARLDLQAARSTMTTVADALSEELARAAYELAANKVCEVRRE